MKLSKQVSGWLNSCYKRFADFFSKIFEVSLNFAKYPLLGIPTMHSLFLKIISLRLIHTWWLHWTGGRPMYTNPSLNWIFSKARIIYSTILSFTTTFVLRYAEVCYTKKYLHSFTVIHSYIKRWKLQIYARPRCMQVVYWQTFFTTKNMCGLYSARCS